MRGARRAGIGVLVLLIAISTAGCAAERTSAPSPSTEARVTAPTPVAQSTLPAVPSAVPTALSIPALGLSAAVRVMGASACPMLNPPTRQDAYWIECRAKPGTDSDGTVFIIGHSIAGGHGVFNDLQRLSVGDDVDLSTPSGTLTYRVQRTTNHTKFGEVQHAPEVVERVPGRLVLVTCFLGPGGTETDKNFVAQAELVAASPQR
jgi:LPXTG-site transpeptidase (sortase) family protein